MSELKKDKHSKQFRMKTVALSVFIFLLIASYFLNSVFYANTVIFQTTLLTIIAIAFSSYLSLRSDYLYNSRQADMQIVSNVRSRNLDNAIDWLNYSVIYRLEARTRGYSGLLAIYSGIVDALGLLIFLVTKLNDWYMFAISLFFFSLSFIFVIFDVKNKIDILDGPPFIKRKIMSLPKRYDWVENIMSNEPEIKDEYLKIKSKYGNDEGSGIEDTDRLTNHLNS